MANEIIRPSALPPRASPVASEVTVSDNGASVAGVTWTDGVNAAAPVASQLEAEAGVDNSKRMTPLTTKQAIDAQVPPKINTAISSLNLGTASQAQVGDFATAVQGAKADSAVQPSDLSGVATSGDYEDLENKPTARLMPAGGVTSQVLVKSSNTNYDVEWATSAEATAVSYAPQTLTSAQKGQARTNIGAALRGHIHGLTLSNNVSDATNDIDISAGEAASIEGDPVLMVLASSLTKRLDATWAAGTGQGGRDAGDSLADTTYHVHLIKNLTSGAVDVVMSSNPAAPHTMPAGFTASRRIGSIIRNSGAIMLFRQTGDHFNFPEAVAVRNSPAAQANTLLAFLVPNGVRTRPIVGLLTSVTAASDVNVGFGDGDATSPINIHSVGGGSPSVSRSVVSDFWTNTTRQLRFSVTLISGSISTGVVYLTGYIDMRGKI